MSDFSSFEKDKKIFDGWRQFLNESAAPGMVVLDEDENLEEQGIGGGSEIRPADVGLEESDEKKELRLHPPKSGKLTDKFTVGPDTVEDAAEKAKKEKEKSEKKDESLDYDAIIQEIFKRLTKV